MQEGKEKTAAAAAILTQQQQVKRVEPADDAPLAPGTRVRLRGLVSRSDLNGSVAVTLRTSAIEAAKLRAKGRFISFHALLTSPLLSRVLG
jgi:hypothetical protein